MRSALFALGLPLVAVSGLGLALALGGPGEPRPMASIINPFKSVDFSGLPAPSRFQARDGSSLAYRAYPAAGPVKGAVVLVHGSSASSNSMHPMAKALAAAGFDAYALDIRGHGDSGPRGTIAYIGQLEDDLEDFLASVRPARPTTLAGFSSGGGFALRFAGSPRQKLFSNYLLLSPFLSADSPTFRPGAGGWVRIGVPRILALSLLNAVGVRCCNGLTVARFALDEQTRPLLTPQYSYALGSNFQPLRDYRANIRAVGQPLSLMAGLDDEVFHTDRFQAEFHDAGRDVPVTLLPGVDHVALTLDPGAVRTAVALVERMDLPG